MQCADYKTRCEGFACYKTDENKYIKQTTAVAGQCNAEKGSENRKCHRYLLRCVTWTFTDADCMDYMCPQLGIHKRPVTDSPLNVILKSIVRDIATRCEMLPTMNLRAIERRRVRFPARQAFTLVECLIVLGITMILLALVLPAILFGRESARRSICISNLKQIGIAINAYQASYGMFPQGPTNGPSLGITGQESTASNVVYSVQSKILPYLNSSAQYDYLNFDQQRSNVKWLVSANETIMHKKISSFLCPSDPYDLGPENYGANNYRFCNGTSTYPTNIFGIKYQGYISPSHSLKPNAISDGLSKTVAASEHLIGDWQTDNVGRGDFTGTTLSVVSGPNIEPYLSECKRQYPGRIHFSRSGETWLIANYAYTIYNQIIPPMSMTDCTFGRAEDHPPHSSSNLIGIFSPSSGHSSGVNLVNIDGSVVFIQTSVDEKLWQSMGTTNAND